MIGINAGITGIDKLLRRLNQLDKGLEDGIKDVVEDITLLIQRQAVNNAPVAGETVATKYGTQKINTGISQLIDIRYENNGYIGVVFVSNTAGPLPIYIEFGTGTSAAGYVPTLPKWAQDVARKYYINGKGTLIKQPFLLPAYFQYAPALYEKLKKLVNTKINS